MSYTEIINEIESLEHFKEICCPKCGQRHRVHILQITLICSKCKEKMKLRGYAAIGSEIQDVIDAVILWMGEGENFEAVMSKHKRVMKAKREDEEIMKKENKIN